MLGENTHAQIEIQATPFFLPQTWYIPLSPALRDCMVFMEHGFNFGRQELGSAFSVAVCKI